MILVAAIASTAAGAETEIPSGLEQQVAQLLRGLDDDRQPAREKAALELARLANQKKLSRPLSRLLRQALLQPATSFEVRLLLKPLLEKLPLVELDDGESVDPSEIPSLIRLLNSDDYGARLGAASRLQWAAKSKRCAEHVMKFAKRELARIEVRAEVRRRLNTAYRQSRGVWLLRPIDPNVPRPEVAQIERWVADLSRSLPSKERETLLRAAAERELLDALARDDCVDRVKALLERVRETGDLDAAADARAEEILDWCKPGMVAEYWTIEEENGVL
ncbi:MAG: hypothetical protein N2C14_26560, partial [Planctomycetales bacterium]